MSADFLVALGSLLGANPPPAALRPAFERLAPLGLTLEHGYNADLLEIARTEPSSRPRSRAPGVH